MVSILGVAASLALTFIGLTAITFTIGRVMPADPVLAIVGDRAPQDVYDQVYQQLGLDKPIYIQYLRYLGQLAEGDLGVSIMTAQPVMDDILRAGNVVDGGLSLSDGEAPEGERFAITATLGEEEAS